MFKIISIINNILIKTYINTMVNSSLADLNALLQKEHTFPTIKAPLDFHPYRVHPNNSPLNFTGTAEKFEAVLDHAKHTKQLHRIGLFQETGSFRTAINTTVAYLKMNTNLSQEQKKYLLSPILSIYNGPQVEKELITIGISAKLISETKAFLDTEDGNYIKSNISLTYSPSYQDILEYKDDDLTNPINPVNQQVLLALENKTFDQHDLKVLLTVDRPQFLKSILSKIPKELFAAPIDEGNTTPVQFAAIAECFDAVEIALEVSNCLQTTSKRRGHIETIPKRIIKTVNKGSNLLFMTLSNKDTFFKVVDHLKTHNKLSMLFEREEHLNGTPSEFVVSRIFGNTANNKNNWTTKDLMQLIKVMRPVVSELEFNTRNDLFISLRESSPTHVPLFDTIGFVDEVNQIKQLKYNNTEPSKAETLALAKANPTAFNYSTDDSKRAICFKLLINGHFDTIKELTKQGIAGFEKETFITNTATHVAPIFHLQFLLDKSPQNKQDYFNAIEHIIDTYETPPVVSTKCESITPIIDPAATIHTLPNTTVLHRLVQNKALFIKALEAAKKNNQLHRIATYSNNASVSETLSICLGIKNSLKLTPQQTSYLLAPIFEHHSTEHPTPSELAKTTGFNPEEITATIDLLQEATYLRGTKPTHYNFDDINEIPTWYIEAINSAKIQNMAESLLQTDENKVSPLILVVNKVLDKTSLWNEAHFEQFIDLVVDINKSLSDNDQGKLGDTLLKEVKKYQPNKSLIMKMMIAIYQPQEYELIQLTLSKEYSKATTKATAEKLHKNNEKGLEFIDACLNVFNANPGYTNVKNIRTAQDRLNSIKTKLTELIEDKQNKKDTNTAKVENASKRTKSESEEKKKLADNQAAIAQREAENAIAKEQKIKEDALKKAETKKNDEAAKLQAKIDKRNWEEMEASFTSVRVTAPVPNEQTQTTINTNKAPAKVKPKHRDSEQIVDYIAQPNIGNAKNLLQHLPLKEKTTCINDCIKEIKKREYDASTKNSYLQTLHSICNELRIKA
jgi:hypothetical protein